MNIVQKFIEVDYLSIGAIIYEKSIISLPCVKNYIFFKRIIVIEYVFIFEVLRNISDIRPLKGFPIARPLFWKKNSPLNFK